MIRARSHDDGAKDGMIAFDDDHQDQDRAVRQGNEHDESFALCDGLLPGAGHNLGLLMRALIGAGTPKEAAARGKALTLLVLLPDGSILLMLAAISDNQAVLAALSVATPPDW